MARRPIVTGHQQVAKNLRELQREAERAAVTAARAALVPMRDMARQTSPRQTGRFRRAITIRRSRQSSRLNPIFELGVRRPFYRILHLLEFGFVHKDGSVVPGSRFMTRTFEAHKDNAVKVFGERFWAELAKRMARMRVR